MVALADLDGMPKSVVPGSTDIREASRATLRYPPDPSMVFNERALDETGKVTTDTLELVSIVGVTEVSDMGKVKGYAIYLLGKKNAWFAQCMCQSQFIHYVRIFLRNIGHNNTGLANFVPYVLHYDLSG